MVSDIIGSRIRSCRQQKTLTQEALAEMLFVSHQTVSKWENGLLIPDVTILVKLAGIFQVSMDYLCGIEMGEQEKVIKDIIQKANYNSSDSFDGLKKLNEQLEKKMEQFPLNDELLNHQLHLLRKMHDTIQSDEQKEFVNDLILICAEKLLDFSKNDDYRSYANFNMALYYAELEQDATTLKKAKEYADKVLYKDMYPGWYYLFGCKIDSNEYVEALHKTIDDATKTIKS